MADWLALVCIFTVFLGFLSLGLFLSRLGILEARAFVGPVVRSAMDVPAKTLVEVRNPFFAKLDEDRPFPTGSKFSFLFSNTVPCYVRTYWGVSAVCFENAVARELDNDDDDDDDDDGDDDDYDDGEEEENRDSADGEEVNEMISADRVLSGYFEITGPLRYYNQGKEHVINIQIPSEFESQLKTSCTQEGSQMFPLVFVMERSRINNAKSCDITSFITTLRCSKSSADNITFSIDSQYIQIRNGNIFPLKKLYVSDSQSSESDTTSSDNITDSSQGSNTAMSCATCVVCHSMPVSRVLLPCRHACVCGSCFSKLEAKCPMCRQWIMSYFVTLDEPELTCNEHETSRELNAMSASEILGGIFRAS